MIDAVILASVTPDIEHQVDGLAHLTLLEQSGIALGRHLNDLIFGGGQLQQVLTRLDIRTNGHRMTRHVNICSITVIQTIAVLISCRLHGLIVLLANQVGSVVAFQLHYNLDGIAEIID